MLILRQGRNQEAVKLKQLAKVVGKISSSIRALGQCIQIILRSIQQCMDEQVSKTGWDSSFFPPADLFINFESILESMDESNGQPILTSKTGISLNTLVPGCSQESLRLIQPPMMPAHTFGGVVASDTRDRMDFAFSVDQQGMEYQGIFLSSESGKSSGFRELLTIFRTVQNKISYFKTMEGNPIQIFYWLTDSQNTYYWFKSGS